MSSLSFSYIPQYPSLITLLPRFMRKESCAPSGLTHNPNFAVVPVSNFGIALQQVWPPRHVVAAAQRLCSRCQLCNHYASRRPTLNPTLQCCLGVPEPCMDACIFMGLASFPSPGTFCNLVWCMQYTAVVRTTWEPNFKFKFRTLCAHHNFYWTVHILWIKKQLGCASYIFL